MKENDLRNSKNEIPELDENLKGKIIDKYENSKPKFKFKLWHGLTLSGLAAASVIVAVVISSTSSMANDSINASEERIAESGVKYIIPGDVTTTVLENKAVEEKEEKEYIVVGGGEEIHYSIRDGVGDGTYVEGLTSGTIAKKTSDSTTSSQEIIPYSQLTASAINDNEDDFDYFKELVSKGQETDGEFYQYYTEYSFKTKNRVKVTIPSNVSATCKLLDGDDNLVYSSVFDKQGNAYLYSTEAIDTSYSVVINYLDSSLEEETVTYNASSTIDLTNEISGLNNYANVIDLMVVIDTTGSMGDEINYLKSELSNVIKTISTSCDATINLSIIAYRDEGDDYVKCLQDFTTNIDSQKVFLSSLTASGGGDFEEAVEQALELSNTASWSNNSTKIMLFVADAPAHDEYISKWNDEVKELANKGVRLITLASSGIDKKTEYFFRCQSMMTGGYYTYLTDDSGIGEAHTEATKDKDYPVEYANAMLIRLIKGYYTGTFESPVDIKNSQEEQ